MMEGTREAEYKAATIGVSCGIGNGESAVRRRRFESYLIEGSLRNSPSFVQESPHPDIASNTSLSRDGGSVLAKDGEPDGRSLPIRGSKSTKGPTFEHNHLTSKAEQTIFTDATEDGSSNKQAKGSIGTRKEHSRGVSWFDIVNIAVEPSLARASSLSSLAGAGLNLSRDQTGSTDYSVKTCTSSPPLQPKLDSCPGTKQKSFRHARRETTVTFADIHANPIETQAEAAIFKALERKDWLRDAESEDDKLRRLFGTGLQAGGTKGAQVAELNDVVDGRSRQNPIRENSVDGSLHDGSSKHKEHRRKPTIGDLTGQLIKLHEQADMPTESRTTFGNKSDNVTGEIEAKIHDKLTISSVGATSHPASPVESLAISAEILFGGASPSWEECLEKIESQGSPSGRYQTQSTDLKVAPTLQGSNPLACNCGDHLVGSNETEGQSGVWKEEAPNNINSSLRIARRRLNSCRSILRDAYLLSMRHKRFYLNTVMYLIFLPVLGISSILFYVAGNPIAGCSDTLVPSKHCASWSWWLIFLGIRQVLTLCLSKIFEVFVVDVMALRTRLTLRAFGPFGTLMIVQARGWPYILTCWALWDFGILYGKRRLASHWLFRQGLIKLFNDNNPSGSVVYSDLYFSILIAAIVAGVSSSIKRVLLALYMGKKSTEHYGPQVEKMMHDMILVTSIAQLAEEIKRSTAPEPRSRAHQFLMHTQHIPLSLAKSKREGSSQTVNQQNSNRLPMQPSQSESAFQESIIRLRRSVSEHVDRPVEDSSSVTTGATWAATDYVMSGRRAKKDISLRDSAKQQVCKLLGEWEEPKIRKGIMRSSVSINDILQFRQAVNYLNQKYPFSRLFGSSRTREDCIESAQRVYERLLRQTPDCESLPFETIARAAINPENGELDEYKAKRLIRLYPPDRDGYLTAIDFVKSCDKIYRKLRTLHAAIANSSQIERALATIVNWIFYFILAMIVLTILEFDPWTIFISLSGLILSFAFMFGKAASSYFEGILLILVRRPYDIGDRIAIADSQLDADLSASLTWFVEEVTLFTTTVRNAATNEVATFTNSALANTRIINGARSHKANVSVYLKFGSDVPYEKIVVFKSVVETFVKDRPRQWSAMFAFRAIAENDGYVEYKIMLEHVEKWQNLTAISESRADFYSFCLEVAKKLGMKYRASPKHASSAAKLDQEDDDDDYDIEPEDGPSNVYKSENEGRQRYADRDNPDIAAIASLFSPAGKHG